MQKAMTSPRQTAANRANARRSTGPRTAAGRARSSRNATRHGLSVSALADPRLSNEVLALAHAIAAAGGSFEAAVVAAEATFALRRIRDHRHHLLASALAGLTLTPAAKECAASADAGVLATATSCVGDGDDGAELKASGAAEADGEREAGACNSLRWSCAVSTVTSVELYRGAHPPSAALLSPAPGPVWRSRLDGCDWQNHPCYRGIDGMNC